MIWLAWVAGLVTAVLSALIVLIEVRRQTPRKSDGEQPKSFRPHIIPGVPAPPVSFVPFIAAATLIALGIAFVAGNAVDDSPIAMTVPQSGCTADPVLHLQRAIVANRVAIVTLSGASLCASRSIALYIDAAQPLFPLRIGDSITWFSPELAAGTHAYLLAVTAGENSGSSLTGTIEAKNPIGFADIAGSAGSLFGAFTALAGVIAAMLAIFKRA